MDAKNISITVFISENLPFLKTFVYDWYLCISYSEHVNHDPLYLHGLTLHIMKKKIVGQIFKRSFA